MVQSTHPGESVPYYFDHNATTPLATDVVTAMSRAFGDDFGNP